MSVQTKMKYNFLQAQSNLIRYNWNHNSQSLRMQIRVVKEASFFFPTHYTHTHTK